MKFSFASVVSLLSLASSTCAASLAKNSSAPIVAFQTDATQIVAATFEQLIDHTNPSLGTFIQRYWYKTQFWNGPGSPIVLYTPGELDAENFVGYLDNDTLTGQYAQAINGAGIVLEHRYWGQSSPFTELTPANLQYLTVPQAIQDLVYFAKNVQLPFDLSGKSLADKSPWVLVGGSYSGALTAWTEITAPGTFWAYHASSASVEAIENFWTYFQPIQQGMPANCSSDLMLAIEHIDSILINGSSTDIENLKTMFGLGTVVHNADFAQLLSTVLYTFQNAISNIVPFCDALEGIQPGQISLPGANGVGLQAAVSNYAAYIKLNYGSTTPDYYDSYNANRPIYTNTILDPFGVSGRPWQWMLCNEALGFWFTGAPVGQPTIVSRLLTPDFWQQQCTFYFPGVTFGITEDQHNAVYKGWNIEDSTRLMFSSGQFDPWRSAGVSSEFRPGGQLVSTPQMPVFIVPNGVHCQDLFMLSLTPEIATLMAQEVSQMTTWVAEYYSQANISSSTSSTISSTPSASASIPSSSSSLSTTASISTSTSMSTSIPTPSPSADTTSTIFSTTTDTITSCATSVTNCPGNSTGGVSSSGSSSLSPTNTSVQVKTASTAAPSQFTGAAIMKAVPRSGRALVGLGIAAALIL